MTQDVPRARREIIYRLLLLAIVVAALAGAGLFGLISLYIETEGGDWFAAGFWTVVCLAVAVAVSAYLVRRIKGSRRAASPSSGKSSGRRP